MKYILFLLLVLLTPPVLAQEQTLVGAGDIENGGFGGPAVKITKINGEIAALVGGRGGWIINHTFVIGAAGYGLVTNVNANNPVPGRQYIELGYGGLDLEYIPSSNSLIHLSIELLIGGGGIGFKNNPDNIFNNHYAKQSFFVLEPSVCLNLNITHFFRIAGGVSYRYINGLESSLSTNTDLSAPSAILTLKFGKF